jgi:hypothetical protein
MKWIVAYFSVLTHTLHKITFKNDKHLNRNSRHLIRESSPRPTEYEREMLINKYAMTSKSWTDTKQISSLLYINTKFHRNPLKCFG